MNLQYASKSDVGKRRSENQDTIGKFPVETSDPNYTKGRLFIVADGMGGHERGKEASETAVRIISESFYKSTSESIPDRLRRAFREANEAIYTIASANDGIHKMGTTCSALAIIGDRAYIGHIGDSRVYRIYKSGIEKLTDDHTQVAEMFKRGILTKKEAKDHPSKSVLSRALGTHPEVEIDIIDDISLRHGDNFLLSTDGLAKVGKDELKRVVLSQSPESACSILVDYANQRGGEDNISVLLVRIESRKENTTPVPPASTGGRDSLKGVSRFVLYAGILLAVGFILYAFNVGGVRERPVDDEGVAEHSLDKQIQMQFDAAHSYVERGELDTAVILYRHILRENPLHVGAIRGIDRVAEELVKRGDDYRRDGKIDDALQTYTQASLLQPQSEDIKSKIQALRESVIQNQHAQYRPPGRISTEPFRAAERRQPTDTEPEETIHERTVEWSFPGLADSEFIKGTAAIRFIDTPTEKKAIYLGKSEDVDILVEAKRHGAVREGAFGILIGYSDRVDDGYFLFTADHTNTLKLRKIARDTDTILISIPPDTGRQAEDGILRLKVKLLGPWIMLYKNEKMLQAWLHGDIIRGNIGLYADPDIEVQFSNIKIQSALNTFRE